MEYAPLVESAGLETSILGVQFRVAESDDVTGVALPPGGVQLNCTAAIGAVYWQSTSWTLRREQDKLTETMPAAATSTANSSSTSSCSVAFLLILLINLVAVNNNQ